MKRIMLLLLIVLASRADGANYFVNSLNGLDSNTGLSPSTAWKTISRVNSNVFSAGDTILFKRGCTWAEGLSVFSSGTATLPIVYTAYGLSGEAVISGGEAFALAIAGQNNLRFERLCFRDRMVYLRDANQVTFACCIIRNSNDRGMHIENSSGISVLNCNITLTRYEGILARGASTTVTVRNSLIFGNGESVSFSGFYASDGATITYDHNLVSGNGYTPAFNLYGSGLVDQGGNLPKADPKVASLSKRGGYFVICSDDYNYTYWNKLNATLKPLGVNFTIFVNGAMIHPTKTADLRALAKAGNEIASHGWSHSSLTADTLFVVSTSNFDPWMTIDAENKVITLACKDTTKNVVMSWADEPKTILDLREAASEKDWEITVHPDVSDRVRLSSIAGTREAQVAFPCVVRPDVSAPDYAYWRDEITLNQTWAKEQLDITPVSIAYPGGMVNDAICQYSKDTAGLLGGRTIVPRESYLASTNVYRLPGTGIVTLKGNGSEAAVRANARCIALHAAQIGSIFVIYTHNEAEMNLKQMTWFVDEVKKNGGKFSTFGEAVRSIRADHVTHDGYTFTKQYPDSTNFHLLPGSSCINTGTAVPIAFDYEGKPMGAGGGYDIGAFESEGVPPTFKITSSAGANGTITPSGTVTAPWGGDQTFTIKPKEGYRIVSVIVDNAPVGPVSTYTFGNVSCNHAIQAVFAEAKDPVDTETHGVWAASPYSGSGDHDFRIPIKAGSFTLNGDRVRINVAASLVDSLVVVQAFIGEKAASGDPYDMTPGSIFPITFNKGNTSTIVPVGGELASDWMDFTLDRKKEYIVSLGVSGGYNAWYGAGSGSWYYWNTQNTGAPDVKNYIASKSVYVMERIEIGTVAPDTAVVTETYGNWAKGDNNSKSNQNFRLPIPSGSFTINANSFRINLEASAAYPLTVVGAYIGEVAATGDPYDMDPDTILPITFNGGSSSVIIPAHTTRFSDWMPIPLDPTRSYIISLGVKGGYHTWVGMGQGTWYELNGESKADIPNLTGMRRTSTTYALERLEVTTASRSGAEKIASMTPTGEENADFGHETRKDAIECFPNPFNMSTTIQVTLSADNQTRISIYNIAGQKVRDLLDRHLSAGRHAMIWNGTDDRGRVLSSGIYFARLQSGGTALARRMIFMK